MNGTSAAAIIDSTQTPRTEHRDMPAIANATVRLIVNGCNGCMGRLVTEMAEDGFKNTELAARVDRTAQEGGRGDCYSELPQFTGSADCVLDFSHHSATRELLDYCLSRRLPLVIATTGQTDEERRMIEEASREIPIFFSSNMSIGGALLAELARKAAAMFPDADIEIVETHHTRKQDAPSGTALMIANAITEVVPGSTIHPGRTGSGARPKGEIGIHSLRLGNEVGTHEVIISTGSETITLKHQASDRRLFAEGAFSAVRFICGKTSGIYTTRDIIEGR